MNRPGYDWRDPIVARTQASRDLEAFAWAPRRMNYAANIAAGLAIALLMVSFAVWGNLL